MQAKLLVNIDFRGGGPHPEKSGEPEYTTPEKKKPPIARSTANIQ